jgi:hypothetical protein
MRQIFRKTLTLGKETNAFAATLSKAQNSDDSARWVTQKRKDGLLG